MGNIGFRVFARVARPAAELVERYKKFAVANIGDAMGRFQVIDYQIKTINKPDIHMAGPAITIRVRPGDNLMVHKALDMAKPGDVLVVDAQGSTLNGLWGEIMTKMAMKKGLAGLVIDGGVRDAKEINQLGFPVFSRAVIAAGGDKDGLGEVNIPINCGGVPVHPGDIVVGDYDGVVVIPQKEAAEVAEKTEAIEKKEAEIFAAIEDGTIDRCWVDETLKKKGCELLE